MATLELVTSYSMYVIGEVESHWNWASVNTADPITCGMLQWFGSRAKNLLLALRDEDAEAYALIADSLRTDLEGSHNDSYWSTRYMTAAEGNTVSAALATEAGHTVQQSTWAEDVQAYWKQMEIWGLSLDRPRELIFCMSMFHQSPAQCTRVIRSCGGQASLQLMFTTAMNDVVFGQYRSRYVSVYNRLLDWDMESEPPDFGQDDVDDSVGDTDGIEQIASLLGYIIQRGNDLYLYGREQYGGGVPFHKAANGRWVNGYNADGTPIEGGSTGGGSAAGSAAQQDICDLVRKVQGQFAYSQGAGRLDPPSSGYTDCSGFVWWVFWTVCGIDVNRNGTKYMLQQARDQGRIVKQGSYSVIGSDELQVGDIVLIGWASMSGEVNHCEVLLDDGYLWGQPGPGAGPSKNYPINSFGTQCDNWWVVRYL